MIPDERGRGLRQEQQAPRTDAVRTERSSVLLLGVLVVKKPAEEQLLLRLLGDVPALRRREVAVWRRLSDDLQGKDSPCVEVSVSFDADSSVTYSFQEPFSVMRRPQPAGGARRAGEDVTFSFVTKRRPAMLLSGSSFSQLYIAVLLANNALSSRFSVYVPERYALAFIADDERAVA
ncbi:Contactin-associated protein-like 5 [Liparis tanakae]|uniref:Contactin-associated protein-like 5 n=1 Tax=Liparis tanakae TaxID=230148 RepID=A0A4Z2H9F2_9TELE|nr:Contactin-associated protein-like 5 [Liparis tanakae]